MTSAQDLHARGVRAMNRGRHREARRLLERARADLDSGRSVDADLAARVGASLAYVLSETGAHDEAMELCRRSLGMPDLMPATRGVLHSQLGLLQMLRGETASAMEHLDAALPLLDEPARLARVHLSRGNVRLQRKHLPEAAGEFERSFEAYRDAGDEYGAAKARHNLGYTQFLAGDLVAALRDLAAAYPMFADESPVMRAMVEQDRAEVLMAAGLVAEGSAALAAAVAAYGPRGLHQRRGEGELALARSLVDRDAEAARAAARQAVLRFRRTGAEAWRVRAEATMLSADVATGRVDQTAIDRGRDLAEELEQQGLRWEATQARLDVARVLVRLDRADQARVALRTLRLGRRAPLAQRLLDRDVRAELAAADGRRANALQHLRAGLADLHEWQSSFGSLDLQTGVAGAGTRLGVRGLALAVGSRKPAVLFEWSERARMLASRVQPVRAPADEQIVADLAELREMATESRRDAAREAELRQRVRERAWQHRGSGEVADPVTLDEVVAALDDGTALAAYVVTATAAVALIVTSAGATWVDLGHRDELDTLLGGLLPDLDMAASDLPDAMGAFVRAELAGRLGVLADLLVAPVLDAVGSRRVVLTPSGVLAGVPWTLLPGYVGRPVTVAQSATAWLGRRTTPLRVGSAGFVAGPRVARAEDEVTAAAKEWTGARVLTGADANAAAVTELAESVDVLHVAAHGRHSAENAMFAGLQLADGPWFGYDVDRLRRVPDVVLLSACEVGRSTVRWGEELIGMTTAWLHAGARCVIASPAAVNDRAAYDVLVAVHQRLAAGLDPAAALAEAVPAVSADSAPVPLVCFG
ncbi:CHAT domain-containing protein [Nocardioides mangrovi]|uniref:CHAT domain-containing protein n=1 Tax=Nocardioides mangrovi TaxID=2874580 RepID=A0ABS7UAY5_9ACTN|nr:CHAT domain-containing protein [Nocardioides mangrovi]MBZ5738159.1 CHAT domain-containing protein [Nocardioides mangrovi]